MLTLFTQVFCTLLVAVLTSVCP